jgi:hypothetical protein
LRPAEKIPAFLSIDVEPDGFQLDRAQPPRWVGYEAIFELTEGLRSALLRRSGTAPKFGWYFRTDPQIAEVYGRPDYALAEFPDRIAYLREKDDYLGVHSHAIRWCEERRVWIHDFANPRWSAECATSALNAFAQWNGSPARRFRAGAGFLTNEIVAAIAELGVQVDMSLEPVDAWPESFAQVPSGIDATPYTGIHASCLPAPRWAYRPSRDDFRIAETKTARGLIVVPLTTYASRRPRWRRLLDFAMRKTAREDIHVLHLSEEWPDAKTYWDRAGAEIARMARPYLSVAVRTDAPGTAPLANAQRRLAALLDHPLSERLEFLDPIAAAPGLV